MQQRQMTYDAFTFPYTLQYVGKIPYLYELKNIFLWGQGPILASLSFIGVFYVISVIGRTHLRGGVAPQSNVAGTFDVPPAAHLGGELTQWLKSRSIVVIGKGETGGRPIIQLFKQMEIEPTVIDSKTSNPEQFTKNADIIISAVGKPNVIEPRMIKKNSILISIGLSKGKDGKLHGDYDEEKIKNIASFYTPTPGGVGPVNVAMLLENLVTAAET